MIGRIFFWLFHVHKWKIIKEGSFNTYDEEGKTVETGRMYVLQCGKCGNLKEKQIRVHY